MERLEFRKKDHIDLAFKSQTGLFELDQRFHYEPMLKPHPAGELKPIKILGKEQKLPLWVSSMTGGTKMAGTINRNLARACKEFGMGMGLGSCRILMEDVNYFEDFNMRKIIGDDLPLMANLGIAQIEVLLKNKQVKQIHQLVDKLQADGLVVHVNPMQEWIQPEGNLFKSAPIDTLKRLLDQFSHPVIVKEVGQGMGPESLSELLRLPLQAIEFGAFGGTNFAKVEMQRNGEATLTPFEALSSVGESAKDMLDYVNEFVSHKDHACRELIISGGIKTFLDGYYLTKKSTLPAIYGMASTFLKYAREDYEQLREFVQSQVKGLAMAEAYLSIRK